jgi:hypothetical protein
MTPLRPNHLNPPHAHLHLVDSSTTAPGARPTLCRFQMEASREPRALRVPNLPLLALPRDACELRAPSYEHQCRTAAIAAPHARSCTTLSVGLRALSDGSDPAVPCRGARPS